MIGSALAAVISIGTGVEAYSIGVGGLPGILSIKPQFWLSFLAAMAVAIVIPFTLTFVVGKRKLAASQAAPADNSQPVQAEPLPQQETAAPGEIKSPCPAASSPWRRFLTRCSPRVCWARAWALSPRTM